MQGTTVLLDLPLGPLGYIASFVSNWKSFILVCKQFEMLNSEQAKLLKYCKVRSFKNKYPNITSNGLLCTEWISFPNYKSSLKERTQKCPASCPDEPFEDILKALPFKEALTKLLEVFRVKPLCHCYITNLCSIVASRNDLNTSDIIKVYQGSSRIPAEFVTLACLNTNISLDDLSTLVKYGSMWRTSYTIGRRSDLVFSDITKYPAITWDLPDLIKRVKLTDDELDFILSKTGFGPGTLNFAPNPYLTWDQMTRCYQDVITNKKVGLMAWACTTFEKALTNLSSELPKDTYFMDVLLNPNYTFKQVDILFEYKISFDQETKSAQPVIG